MKRIKKAVKNYWESMNNYGNDYLRAYSNTCPVRERKEERGEKDSTQQ